MPARADLTRLRLRVRRAVLRRRRVLAALLLAVAVASGVRAVAAPPPPTVPVLTARHDLPAGTVLTAADLETVAFAAGTEPAAVAAAPVGRTLAAPLRRGEPVTDVRLVGEALAQAHPDLVAVPVRLPDAGAVALLAVGDLVDLVATDPQAGGAQVVAAGVRVLALPRPGADDASGFAGQGALVVVGVDPVEVTAVSEAAARLFLTFAFSR